MNRCVAVCWPAWTSMQQFMQCVARRQWERNRLAASTLVDVAPQPPGLVSSHPVFPHGCPTIDTLAESSFPERAPARVRLVACGVLPIPRHCLRVCCVQGARGWRGELMECEGVGGPRVVGPAQGRPRR